MGLLRVSQVKQVDSRSGYATFSGRNEQSFRQPLEV